MIVSIDIDIGYSDTTNSPTPKNAVKIMPITTSVFNPDRSLRNSIKEAASPPEINAPIAKGKPNKYAPATPGTTE